VGVEVYQMGSATCGKPYGFYPWDNCGTTYFSVQFEGRNAKNFGDYPDGFTPQNSPVMVSVNLPGCWVADDLSHQLGDENEAQLQAALSYRAGGTCPAPGVSSGNGAQAKPTLTGPRAEMRKSAARMNRVLRE
jgi:hypothetical protein